MRPDGEAPIKAICVSIVLVLSVPACGGDGSLANGTTTTHPPTTLPATTMLLTTTTARATTTEITAPLSTTVAPSTSAPTTDPSTTIAAGALADGQHHGMIHFVNLWNASLSFDQVTWVWTGPADTEGYWTNDDETPVLLPIASDAEVWACPEDMSGTFPPMLHCDPEGFVVHTIGKLALWVHNGTEVGQNRRWLGEIAGHNGQLWVVVVSGGQVVEVRGVWRP